MPRGVKPLKTFGRIDPVCWVAVVPVLLVGVALGALGSWGLTLAVVVIIVAVLVFDSWANRPFANPRTRTGNRGSRSEPGRAPRQGTAAQRSGSSARGASTGTAAGRPGGARSGSTGRPPQPPRR